MRSTLRLLALVVALPFLYLAASFALPLIPGPGPDLSGPKTRTIGLIQGAIHTDILLPLTPEVRTRFGFAAAAGVPLNDPYAEWLLLGWGSAAFYTSTGTYADISAGTVLTAATGDSAVLRLEIGSLNYQGKMHFLELSEAQFQALLTQTHAAFAGETPLNHPGFSVTDAFFPAKGRFHLFRTCNVWLGETFRASGIPFGLWTPANWSVALSLNWHLADQTG
ncbi:DUF2459 domain-containing protein [Tabrizicola sp.]|uniref:DUF2459 domain-containing protein n=1 Tax=Tabrizicola sp. TaxID=2005166 RepID=UPI003F417841